MFIAENVSMFSIIVYSSNLNKKGVPNPDMEKPLAAQVSSSEFI